MNKRGESDLSRGIQILIAGVGLVALVFSIIFFIEFVQQSIEIHETNEKGFAVLGLAITAMFVYFFSFGTMVCGLGVILLWFYRLKMYDEKSIFDKFLLVLGVFYTVVSLGFIIACKLL